MSIFSLLPDSSFLTGGAASTLNSAVNYSLANTSSLLNESYAKMQSTFGGTAQFASLTSESATFKTLLGASSKSSNAATAALSSASTATDTASNIKNAATDSSSSNLSDLTTHKVILTEIAAGEITSITNSVAFPTEPLSDRVVEFDVMPDLSEVRTVEYEALSAPQMPTEFQKYKGTKATQWNLSGNMVCRTREEAFRNLQYINTLRGWTEGFFGNKQLTQFRSAGDTSSRGKLGAPPPVLSFAGYRGLIGEVPVVLTSTNWTWPHDCDWIPTGQLDDDGQEVPFPTVMQISMSLVESFSPEQVNSFDLVAFRNGDMIGAWQNILPTTGSAPNVAEAQGGNQSSVQGTAQPDPSTNSNGTAPSVDRQAEAQTYTSGTATSIDRQSSTAASGGNTSTSIDRQDVGAPVSQSSQVSTPQDAPDVASVKASLNGAITSLNQQLNVTNAQLATVENQIDETPTDALAAQQQALAAQRDDLQAQITRAMQVLANIGGTNG